MTDNTRVSITPPPPVDFGNGSLTNPNTGLTPNSIAPTLVVTAPTSTSASPVTNPTVAPTPQVQAGPNTSAAPQYANGPIGAAAPLNNSSIGSTSTAAANNAGNANIPSSTISPASAQSLAAAFMAGTGIPNPFNALWQVAYHWRLFIIGDFDLYTAKPVSNIMDLYNYIDSSLNPIIIAESGITTYNIKSVEMVSVVSANADTRNVNTYKFTVSITEPIGVGFLDALKDAALAVKINNIQKCPYYLDLTFRGYNEQTGQSLPDALAGSGFGTTASTTSAATASSQGAAAPTRWIWQIQITDIETQFDATGGQYTLTCMSYSDSALDTDVLCSAQACIASGATIGAMLTSLGTSLTTAWKNLNGNDLITYTFNMHPIINPPYAIGSNNNPNTYRIQPQNPAQSPITQQSFQDEISLAGNQITIVPGTPFTDIIDWLLCNNEQSANLLMDRNSIMAAQDASPSATNDRKFKEGITFRVENDVAITGYNTYVAEYRRTVTIHVWPYYTQAIVASPEQRDNALSPAVQGAMVSKLLSLGFLVKHYNYLYTGLNTEVLDFEIKSNFKWNALLPKLVGTNSNTDQLGFHSPSLSPFGQNPTGTASEAPSLPGGPQSIVQKTIRLTSQISPITPQLAAQATGVNAATARLTAAQMALANPPANATTAQIAQLKENVYDADSDRLSLTTSQSQLAHQSTVYQQALTLPNTPPQQQLGANQKPPIYAEDLLTGSPAAQTALYQYQIFNYNIQFIQTYKDAANAAGTGMIGQYNRDRSVFGVLIDQLYQPFTTQLSKTDISIRGDPFWLGTSNLHRQVFLRSNNPSAGSQTAINGLPNWLAGDQTYLVTFKYPYAISDQSIPLFHTDDTFAGIYRAVTVTSTFSEGTFKQKLTGLILPLISVLQGFSNISNIGSTTGNSGPLSGKGGPIGSDSSGTSVGAGSTPITTAQQQQNAADFKAALIASQAQYNVQPPLTDAQLDGIVANAYRESSMNPTLSETDNNGLTSAGLLQWNGPRGTAFTNVEGVSPNNATIQQQADYTMQELTNQPGTQGAARNTLSALQGTTTAADAANVWVTQYERPTDPGPDQSVNLGILNGKMYK